VDDVAGIDLAQADDAVDRRGDVGVGDVDLGGLDGGAVGVQGSDACSDSLETTPAW
jgi:hypothetical protein